MIQSHCIQQAIDRPVNQCQRKLDVQLQPFLPCIEQWDEPVVAVKSVVWRYVDIKGAFLRCRSIQFRILVRPVRWKCYRLAEEVGGACASRKPFDRAFLLLLVFYIDALSDVTDLPDGSFLDQSISCSFTVRSQEIG
ncbi:hypothetical protein CJP46_24650 [Paenibacillus sp. XY044]|nr:hypothetical protein CJP46_24650 [Paenibacillus sp. XY044]